MTTAGEVWHAVEALEGWLSGPQAEVLFERASAVPAGCTIVEIGSHHGRSTIMLAGGAPLDSRLIAIDPHAGSDRGPREIRPRPEVGERDHERFHANLKAAGVDGRVRHLRRFSTDALTGVDGDVELLYIDGAHRYRPARDDIARWGPRVTVGGTMLIHDSFNAVGVMLAQFRLLVLGRTFLYIGRTGSLSEYRRQDLIGRERVRNAARQMREVGYFARSIAIKLALVAKLPRAASAFGHEGGPWPY